jgi:hypothetical protein
MELAFRLTEHTLESTATSDTVRATTGRDESIEDAEQQDIADAMSNYVYLAEHEVLICKEHGYAVRGLDSHLRLVHKSYASSSKKARATLRQHYGGRNMPDPSTIRPPEPGQLAIEHLSDPIPGYYCIYGHEYTTSVEDAQGDAPPTATDPPPVTVGIPSATVPTSANTVAMPTAGSRPEQIASAGKMSTFRHSATAQASRSGLSSRHPMRQLGNEQTSEKLFPKRSRSNSMASKTISRD